MISINFWVIHQNEEVFRKDTLVDYSVAVKYHEQIENTNFDDLIRSIFYTNRQPLFFIITAIIFVLVEKSQLIACLISQLFLILSIFSTYKLGTYLTDKTKGLTAALLTATFPIVFATSRVFKYEISALALLPISIYFLFKSENFQNQKFSFLFGISFGIGMLFRETYIIFLGGPLLVYVLGSLIKSKLNIRNVMIVLLVFSLISLPYYISSSDIILSDVKGDLTRSYVSFDYISFENFSYYFNHLPEQITPIFTVLFVISLLVLAINLKELNLKDITTVSWFLFPYFVFTFVVPYN
ncbi:MAG: glycosyltransferase family 39 protein, partial [Candidatus Aenigmatarchaeota archaeon]